MVIFSNIWNFLGKLSLAVWIILALTIDVLIGSIIIHIYRPFFSPLNQTMLPDWIINHGFKNFNITWWIFVLLFLLFLLGINIFVCTTNRVVTLIHQGGSFLKFAPHVMHYAFIMLLFGHLACYTAGFMSFDNPIKERETISVPYSELKIKLENLDIEYQQERPAAIKADHKISLVKGGAKEVSATLSFIQPDQRVEWKTIGVNRPIWYHGLSFHMNDFYPKKEGAPGEPGLNLIIRRDPGIKIIIAGAVIFTLGLLMYLYQMVKSTLNYAKVRKETFLE